MQEVSVFFFGHGYALEHEHERAAGGANVDRFVRGVENEHGREQGMTVPGPVRSRRTEQPGGDPGCWFYSVFHAWRHVCNPDFSVSIFLSFQLARLLPALPDPLRDAAPLKR